MKIVQRIVAKEADGAYKIVRNEVLPEEMPFDERGNRDSNSNGAGGTYCANYSGGCNTWAANANLVGSPAEFTNGYFSGTVLLDSSLNTYLNGEYLESITENSDKIINYNWGVGATYTEASYEDDDDIDPSELVAEEAAYKWNGKVALLSSSDVHLSVSNEELCGTDNKYQDNLETCASNNYLVIPGTYWWLVSPCYSPEFVDRVSRDGYFYFGDIAYRSNGVRPAVYLTSSLSLSGSGTQSDPYRIG